MKHPVKFYAFKLFLLVFSFSFFSLSLLAQSEEGSSSSSTTTTTKKISTGITSNDGIAGNAWYTSPWVWVIGAAVFILLLVALLSNRGRDTVTRDRVVTKTVERDRDV